MNKQFLANIAVVVADYDEAITFYTEALGFELIEDTKLWIEMVKPRNQ